MSIRMRLTLWYSGILAGTLLMFGMIVYGFSYYMLYNNQKNQMQELGRYVTSTLTLSPWTVMGEQQLIPQLPSLDDYKYAGYYIVIRDKQAQVVNRRSNVDMPFDTSIINGLQNSKNGIYFENRKITNRKETSSFLIYNQTVGVNRFGSSSPEFIGILQIGVNVDDIKTILNNLLYFLLLGTLLIIGLAAVIGWFLANKAFKPIEGVIEAAGQIGSGSDLDRRIGYDGPPDEIGQLTETINGMLTRIQHAYGELEESNRTQKRFVSDASHELRTPLTTIRGNVELLQKMWNQPERGEESGITEEDRLEFSQEAMQDIAGESERMSRLVNDLLSLARADAGLQIDKKPLVLLNLVEDVVRNASHLTKSAEWKTGDLSPLEGAVIDGDSDYIRQLLFIFIENAFKYTPEGFVIIDALRTEDQVGIRISDTGIGLDKEEVPHIFQRFYRADPSRGQTSGTGLGLAIAKWIIDEHNGSIEVLTRKGEGSSFVIWLPLRFPELPE